MKFKLFNRNIEIEDINYEETIISNHTNTELKSLYFDLRVVGEKTNTEIQEEIKNVKEGGIFSLDNDGNQLEEYKLLKSPYSYSTTFPEEERVYNYTIYLEEVERLKIEKLIIEDMEFIPYEYDERYTNNSIVIDAKIKINRNESSRLDKFYDNRSYFKVQRRGISNRELTMRFGQVIWSEEDDYIKKDITLVEEVYDKNEESQYNLFQPEMGNIKNMLAYSINLNNELMDLLKSKGVISLEEIKEKANLDIPKTYRKFYKVNDIDKFK